jgi:phosphoglycerate dehydrogenase-like enzyme
MRFAAITYEALRSMSIGEFEHPPMARLWADPRVLITPHISGASDEDRHGAINVFCAYLDGRPLRNVVDWERGY